jgi:hypothetical protein
LVRMYFITSSNDMFHSGVVVLAMVLITLYGAHCSLAAG